MNLYFIKRNKPMNKYEQYFLLSNLTITEILIFFLNNIINKYQSEHMLKYLIAISYQYVGGICLLL